MNKWLHQLDDEEREVAAAAKDVKFLEAELAMLRKRREAMFDGCAYEVAMRWPGSVFVGLIGVRA